MQRELPGEDFIYLADNGHAPYGERDEAHVLARSRAIAAELVARGASVLVVACNTATAAAVAQLRQDHRALPIVGVEPALKPAVALSATKHIGVMATRGTLASAKFQALLAAQSGDARVTLQPCDGLADAIERGLPTIEALCARHLAAMGGFGLAGGEIDTLVLGCTHYPLVESVIAKLTGPAVRLLSTGEAVARQTRKLLPACTASTTHKPGTVTLLSTGELALLQAAAGRWLNLGDDVQPAAC